MKKLLNDILKVNGEYSIKRVLAIIAFKAAILIAIFITVSDLALGNKVINSGAKDVFDSLLMFVSVLIGITEVSKKIENK